MESIRLIARNSRLSLLQADRVKKKIKEHYPGITVEVIGKSSRGDSLQDVPLHTVEGTDFFTQEIFDVLSGGEADIAVHSLKDMSAEHFFGENHFAVVERDDVRDVAIFRSSVLTKIQNSKEIVIGTCSPRREEMVTSFLQKALPQAKFPVRVVTRSIRGNVDTRLQKLDTGEYDAIILAAAGLNRLLNSEIDSILIRRLLENKLLMVLPLFECVPAPCQGAIVAEAHHGNSNAVEVIHAINDKGLREDCIKEKQVALRFGAGCLQRFGVATVAYDRKKCVFAAGRNSNGENFSEWKDLPSLEIGERSVFSGIESMGKFFDYESEASVEEIREPVVYISNHRAIDENGVRLLKGKRVWCAGARTWVELSRKGIWVEGCADAMGLESIKSVFAMPLLRIDLSDVCIVTNRQSKIMWQNKGWKAISTYELKEKENQVLKEQLSMADIVFWTSFRQYEYYSEILKKNVIHVCAAGETAEQLRACEIDPVVFPTFKSFEQWRRSYSLSHNVA